MKKRLDILVFEKGLAPSREQARAYIMAGQIFVNGQRHDKAGEAVEEDALIEFQGKKNPYVSRGGLKLEKALDVFQIDLNELVCMDVGASTGGFTDCMLKRGAAKVYAVDVGYGQLAYTLRTDPRVVCMEKTNIRYLEPDKLAELPDFATADVSFISLKLVLPVMWALTSPRGRCICLVKPQFEAGRESVGKKGVVRDPAVHRQVLETVTAFAMETGFSVEGLDFSPIRGPEGNIEYLLYLAKEEMNPLKETALKDTIQALVESSHRALDKEGDS